MNLIKLNIIGLSYSQFKSGAYALFLEEDNGLSKLSIVIGQFEAQAIAIGLDKNIISPRPLTHDLFIQIAEKSNLILDKVIDIYFKQNLDYCSNTCPPQLSKFPDGSDVEIFSYNSLKKISKLSLSRDYKEHLTQFFWKHNKFNKFILNNKNNLSNFKYSVDTINDFKKIERIVDFFQSKIYTINTNQIISYLKNDIQK